MLTIPLTKTYTLDMESLDDFTGYSAKDRQVYCEELKLVSNTNSRNRILNKKESNQMKLKTFSENGKLYVKTSSGIAEARDFSSYTEDEQKIIEDEILKQKKKKDDNLNLAEVDKDRIISDLKARVAELEAQLNIGNETEE